MTEIPELVGLVLLSLALLTSLCLNVILCIRRRAKFCRDTDKCCFNYTGESPSPDEGNYFHNLNHEEQRENLHNHIEQLENPIYGNISSDRGDCAEVCYEMMTHTKNHMKSVEPVLNYASLDLKMAKKCMSNRHQQHAHAQGLNQHLDELPVHLTAFLDVEADMESHHLSRDASAMVSHSSIYLNSQQIAQETEEMERGRGMNMERESVGWEGVRRWEDGLSREWNGEQESEERDDNNGSVCTQISVVEVIPSGTDHFITCFSQDGDQQD